MKMFLLLTSYEDIWNKNFSERSSQIIFNETFFYKNISNLTKLNEQFNLTSNSYKKLCYPGYANLSSSHIIPITHIHKPNYAVISHNARLLPYNIPLPFGSLLHINENGAISHSYYKNSSCNIKNLRKLNNFSLDNLINDAKSCINIPYLWGGRTIHTDFLYNKNSNCGVDCSGFINLLFRAQGVLIPRDSQQQFHLCKKYKNFDELPIGGLVFLSNQKKINHVMLKISNTEIIDAAQTEKKVRILTRNQTFFIKKNQIEIKEKQFNIQVGKIKLNFFK